MSAVPTIAIALLYLVPVALIALLLTTPGQRLARRLILVTLLALPFFYIAHYALLQQLQGWPSLAPVPKTFRLLGFEITEPNARSADAGQILIWVQGIDQDQPRVHQLAYSKDLHLELVAAGHRQANGKHQIGTREPQPVVSMPGGPREDTRDTINFEDMKGRSLPIKD